MLAESRPAYTARSCQRVCVFVKVGRLQSGKEDEERGREAYWRAVCHEAK